MNKQSIRPVFFSAFLSRLAYPEHNLQTGVSIVKFRVACFVTTEDYMSSHADMEGCAPLAVS
ncbi:MAG: hypothetical protein CSA20_00170 [Deltaproteobacteria bacterium]|nr:MAG: hypothetical protein CSA20_00170 [Deltaproteobacteria bacterium]